MLKALSVCFTSTTDSSDSCVCNKGLFIASAVQQCFPSPQHMPTFSRSYWGILHFLPESTPVFGRVRSCSSSTVSSQSAKTCVLLSVLSACLCVFRSGSVIYAIRRKSCSSVCVRGVTCCLNHTSSFALGDLLCAHFAFPVIIISTRIFKWSLESWVWV